MYIRESYSGRRRRKRRTRSFGDTVFALSTAAAGILSVLAVLIAVRPEFPGIERLLSAGMVAEGATGRIAEEAAGEPAGSGLPADSVPPADSGLPAGSSPQAGFVPPADSGFPTAPIESGSPTAPIDPAPPTDPSAQPDTTAAPAPEKILYLTFDDGPSQENTNAVLDVLKARNIKATFFVVGENVLKHPETARRIVEEGHTIGIHCYEHDYEKIYQSVDSYLEDFDKAYKAVLDVTGVQVKLYRFPGGSINAYNKKVYSEIIARMNARGFIYFDWNASLDDALRKSTPEELIANARNTSMGRKKVVLLGHDIVHDTALCLDQLIGQFPEYRMEPLTPEVDPVQFKP